MDVRARIPFPVHRVDILPSKESEFDQLIKAGIEEVNFNAPEDLPGFLKAFSVHINLHELDSSSTTQILLGVSPQEKSLSVENSEVKIDAALVPGPEDYRPSALEWLRNFRKTFITGGEVEPKFVNMLLTHSQQLLGADSNVIANLRFGTEVKLSSQDNQSGQIEIPLQSSRKKFLCYPGKSGGPSMQAAPVLNGQFAASPLGNGSWWKKLINRVLRNRSVTMSVTEIDVNLKSQNLETTRVTVGTLGVVCVELGMVNEKFKGMANDMLETFKTKYGKPIELINQ